MIGATLSHFKITAKLGEGGMGEVYRAEDTKLGREVAIKVLPETVARDPERLARFEREAKVLASLNHPNIAAIYSIEAATLQDLSDARIAPQEEDEAALNGHPTHPVHFLVMELVEGDDLKERLGRGSMPVEEALPLALQVSEALEAAHERGIIHRDLKPANIKVTPNGQVKVLDFGLAKALDSTTEEAIGGTDLSLSPTLTAQMTQAGVILGTAAYMSPEQAAGEPADRRADIWAFGVVLAEMLTGRPQFDGKTASHVLAAVLKEEPNWERFPSTTPSRILDLIQHCLRKEPSQRLQAIGDARILLQDYLDDPSAFDTAAASEAPPAPATWQRILPWALFGMALAAFLVILFRSEEATNSSDRVLRASILPPEASIFYLAGWNPGPVAVSPDGTKMAFSVQEDTGSVLLYVRSLDSGKARPLPGTDSAAYPFWSPDSRWIGFFTDVDQTLKKIDTSGGPPVTVCDAENGKGGSWSADGTILLAPRADAAIFRVSADGGEPTPVTELVSEVHNSHRHPRFLADGQHFIYLARGATDSESAIMLRSLDGSIDRELVRTPTQGEMAAGRLLFTRGNALMAQPFDSDRLELAGEATALVEDLLLIQGAALGIFSASDTGLLAYNSGVLNPEVSLEWRDRSGNILSTVGEPALFGPIALSPDGKQVMSVNFDAGGIGSFWLTEVETGLRTRFTFDPDSDYGLAWSRDSENLFFSVRRNKKFEIYRKAVSGVGDMELLRSEASDTVLSSVSPDGRTVLFHRTSPGTARDLLVWTIDGEQEPQAFRQTEADERYGSFSPDGKWIAYSSNESGSYEVYVAPFPGPGRRWQVSQAGGIFPQWRADGREIFFSQADGHLMAAPVTTGDGSMQVGTVESLFRIHPPRPDGPSFGVAPDGQHLVVWTNLQRHSETVINLVVNWPAELVTR
jgi:serine/threonine protein kinase